VTDDKGQFALTDLDPELLFRLLAVADGHVPTFTPKHVDPKSGRVTLKLKPHDLDTRDPALVFRGRVVDEKGDPVAEAVVEPNGFRKNGGGQFGGLQGFDPLAVTDAKGQFRLGVPEKGLALYVRVTARYKAPRVYQALEVGRDHRLTLFTGVTVTGRLVKDSRPLPGAAVGLVQRDRNAMTFVGEFQFAADAKGVFRIPNVPPDEEFYFYGLMDSLKAHGAVAAKPVRAGASGTELDVGDVALGPGFHLAGKLVLADGKPVPAGTRVAISRQEAWDYQQAVVDKDGGFAFEGLPPERYSLSANVRGYRPSAKNASLDLLNRFGLLGTVKEDVTGLRLLYEPGEFERPQGAWDQKAAEEYQRRRDAPLRGAPGEPGTKK
jgi:hypothetical protein